MITSKTKRLDLHGEVVAMVEVLVNEFIETSILEHEREVIIIHGKSTNILTNEVHQVLKRNKNVSDFYKNNWNLGETIVELKKSKE